MPNHEVTKLRPTVFIALGGTGAYIGARLWSKMIEVYEETPALFDMLLVDTARPPVVGKGIPEEKFLSLSANSLSDYLDNLQSHSNIRAWLPDPVEWSNIKSDDLLDGAQKVRALGRLSLFVHENAQSLYNRIRSCINGVTGVNLSQRLIERGVAAAAIKPQVYILSSAIGGTGSGILLDVAYMIRQLFGEDGAEVTAVLLLPGIYGSDTLIQANCCACLQEVDYYMTEGVFQAKYPGLTLDFHDNLKPFDVLYLVDNDNQANVTLNTESNAHCMVAEALFAISASRPADAFQQFFVDGARGAVRGRHAVNPAGGERTCFYSSLGAHALRFPRDEAVAICAARWASEMLGLLTRAPDAATKAINEQLDDDVMSFINANSLNEFPHDQIIDALKRTPLDELTRAFQSENQRIQHTKEAGLPRALTDLWQKLEASVTTRWQVGMTEIAENLLVTATADLERIAVARVNNFGQQGPADASEFLRRLQVITEGWSAALKGEADKHEEKARTDAGEFKKVEATLRHLLCPTLLDRFLEWISGVSDRSQRVQRTTERMLSLCMDHHSQRLEAAAKSEASKLMSRLAAKASEVAQSAGQTARVLDTAKSTAQSKVAELTASRSSQLSLDREGNPVITSVAGHADVDDLYLNFTRAGFPQDHYNLLVSSVTTFLKDRRVHDLRGGSGGTLCEELTASARKMWIDIFAKNCTLEQFLTSAKGAESSSILNDLKNKAAPFCALHPGRATGMQNPEKANIYATRSQATTLFATHFPAHDYRVRVSTLDDYEMAVVNTIHGFPLFVLDDVTIYRRSLETMRNSKENPGYAVKDEIASQFPGIDPSASAAISEGREIEDLLDLGLLLELVQIKGASYGYQPLDGGNRIPFSFPSKQGRPAACAFLADSNNQVVRASLERDLFEKIAETTSTSKKAHSWLMDVWIPFRRERLTMRSMNPLRRDDWSGYDPMPVAKVAERAKVNLRDLYS